MPTSSGDVWHAALDNLPASGICYGYKVSDIFNPPASDEVLVI